MIGTISSIIAVGKMNWRMLIYVSLILLRRVARNDLPKSPLKSAPASCTDRPEVDESLSETEEAGVLAIGHSALEGIGRKYLAPGAEQESSKFAGRSMVSSPMSGWTVNRMENDSEDNDGAVDTKGEPQSPVVV